MISSPDNDDLARQAARELKRIDWISVYLDLAFRPFETTQKVAELLCEVQGQQLQDASAFWQEAEDKVWGPNLRLIGDAAYFMWEMAGKPTGMTTSFRTAAQRYIASLMALETKLGINLDALVEEFSPGAYFQRVQDLAQAMSRRAGQQAMTPPLAFWLAAENHILTMLAGVSTAVHNYQDAVDYLRRISDLSNETYLFQIEKGAYYIWEGAGKPFGAALEHWLKSEQAILTRIREEIAGSLLGVLVLPPESQASPRLLTKTP